MSADQSFTPAPIKPAISLADLDRIDIRVGTILSAEDVTGSDKLLFVINLDPKKMLGELSEGMLFDIGYADGVVPALAVPETKVPNGTRAGQLNTLLGARTSRPPSAAGARGFWFTTTVVRASRLVRTGRPRSQRYDVNEN